MHLEKKNNFQFSFFFKLMMNFFFEEIKCFWPLLFNCFNGHYVIFGKAFIMHYNTPFIQHIKSLTMIKCLIIIVYMI